MPGRAVPCIPPPTSPAAWQCPPHPVRVSSVTLSPLQLGTSCGEWPPQPSRPAPPACGAFPPSTAPAAAQGPLPHQLHRGAPAPSRGTSPRPRLPPAPAPAHPVVSGAAPAAPRSPRTRRVPGAGSPLLGQRLRRRRGPPLGHEPTTCPGERLSRRQRGWGWTAGVERAFGINHFAAGGAAQPGSRGPALPAEIRQATDSRQPLPPEPASALRRDEAAAELREPQTALPDLWHKHHEGLTLPCHPAATRLCRTPTILLQAEPGWQQGIGTGGGRT